MKREHFVDIHCHLIPGIDDGAANWPESLAMAQMAVEDGIRTIICTPHQGANFTGNRGNEIRAAVREVQQHLDQRDVPLKLLPGADVRIDVDLVEQLRTRNFLTLGDHGRHVLLELPHELYFPVQTVLEQLTRVRMVGILSHPERNQGILRQPDLLHPLVSAGCLMQVTAGSLMGTFGDEIRHFTEWMLHEGLVHFVATDAHGAKSRRPLLSRAWQRIADLLDAETATRLCCRNPARVAAGRDIVPGLVQSRTTKLGGWFGRRKAG